MKRIVEQHRGWIEVESARSTGSTFRVFFPAPERPVPRGTEARPPIRGGSETLLLVEDDGAVRRATAQLLTLHGYRVIEAANGLQALAQWEKQQGRIDLLFSDMLMPEGLTGEELCARLRARQPELKAILFSGYRMEPGPGLRYLTKPCDPATLLTAIRNMLDGKE